MSLGVSPVVFCFSLSFPSSLSVFSTWLVLALGWLDSYQAQLSLVRLFPFCLSVHVREKWTLLADNTTTAGKVRRMRKTRKPYLANGHVFGRVFDTVAPTHPLDRVANEDRGTATRLRVDIRDLDCKISVCAVAVEVEKWKAGLLLLQRMLHGQHRPFLL